MSTPEQQAAAAAELLLWGLTGRRFGVRDVVGERYRTVACSGTGSTPTPYMTDGGWWVNACGGSCCRIFLYERPVRSVTEVRLHGVVTTDWTLDGFTLTVPGGCSSCDECEAGIEVDYVAGMPWPVAAEAALAELTAEFLAGISGDNCRISTRAVTISRQGITVNLEDSSNLIEAGLTGMPVADAFIRSVNPAGLTQRPRIVPIDHPRRAG